MKKRRTISAEVLLSEPYRKLSASAQSLYVFSLLNADEYGFIDEAYKFVCKNGYKMDDLKPLCKAGFIIVFPNDALLIADWYNHSGTVIHLDESRQTEYAYVTLDEQMRFVELDNLKTLRQKKPKGFVPPTLEEVVEYAKSRNSSVDPVQFFNFFNTPNENGDTWVDTKGQKVNNWKGKFVTWEKFRGGINGRSNQQHSQPSTKWNIHYDVDGRSEA